MDFPAAPERGRRVSLGGLLVLAAFLLLAPPLFLLAPFLLLTVLARPRTPRELFWLIAAGGGVGLALQGPPGLLVDLLRMSGVLLGAIFAVLSLRPSTSLFGRGLVAVVLTALAVLAWEWTRGVTWPMVHEAMTAMLREGYQSLLPPSSGGESANPELRSFIQQFIDAAPALARALPGLLALEGFAGVALAWIWHHRIAANPLGVPPAAFRTFRFNDHLIWGAIFTLALLVVPLPVEAATLAEDLLILWVGLYAMRGLAVTVTLLASAPLPLKVFLTAFALVVSPLTLGICLALGLADTWLDIRGRLTPPVPGGSTP